MRATHIYPLLCLLAACSGDTTGGLTDTADVALTDATDASDPDTQARPHADSTADTAANGVPGTAVVWDWDAASTATADGLAFFDYPWPESRRFDPDGTLALAGFPSPPAANDCDPPVSDPTFTLLLSAISPADYRAYAIAAIDRHQRGFGTSTPVYLHFDGPLTATLPTPAATLSADAAVFLVDVDPASPRRGERVPLDVTEVDDSRYLPAHTLVLAPAPGFPLAAHTRYAAVVLRRLRDAAGAPLGVPPAFARLETAGPATLQETLYADVFDTLAAWGTPRADVAAMTVFTTQATTAALADVADAIAALPDPTALADVRITAATAAPDLGYLLVSGTYRALDYQRGAPPCLPRVAPNFTVTADNVPDLLSPDSWDVTFDPDDTCGELLPGAVPPTPDGADPDQPRTERLDFRLTLPLARLTGQTEADDVPLVFYAHGTGGSMLTPLGPGGVASTLAQLGIATCSITAVMHGPRAHVENLPSELIDPVAALSGLLGQDLVATLDDALQGGQLFFNLLNLHAIRGNLEQSAVDFIWLARVMHDAALAVPTDADPVTVRFDPAHIGYFGHSQGGLTGPLTAFSPELSALFLSAPAGDVAYWITMQDVPGESLSSGALTRYVTCDPGHIDRTHPILAVLGTFLDPGDPLNYMRHLVREPLAGPRHVFVTEALDDHYVPPVVDEAMTTAGELTQVAPERAPVPGQALLAALHGGFTLATADLTGNVTRDGAAWTAGFKQYVGGDGCSDGHFAFLCVPDAAADWQAWWSTWLSASAPTIRAGAP